jgi:hypothetical protein
MLPDEVVELLSPAGGDDDGVARLEGHFGDRPAEAA